MIAEDLHIKLGRLRSKEKAPPRVYPVVRKLDKEPQREKEGCVLCGEGLYQRNTVLLDTPHFYWHTKDYPYIPGDSMITLKMHVDGYRTLSDEVFEDFWKILQLGKYSYTQNPKVREVSILQAVGGRASGQGVQNHFHAHFLPSYIASVKKQASVYSPNNFIIQDASSYYLLKVMTSLYPEISRCGLPSSEFAGGFNLCRYKSPSELLEILFLLEKALEESIWHIRNSLNSSKDKEERTMKLGALCDVEVTPRREKIFHWMLKALTQEDPNFFGYNLFLRKDDVIFLPRSGFYGAKRIGPVSIFANLHWATKDLGNENRPTVYTAPYTDYPPEYKDLDIQVISEVSQIASRWWKDIWS